MSDVVPFELGPLTLAVTASRKGRTELTVSAFDQTLGTLSTTQPLDLDSLLSSEADATALFNLFKDHCVPLLRQRAQRGPASIDALCLRLVHPCDNPQCDAIHELLCMNAATQLLACASPATLDDGTPFTLVDDNGQALGATQFLSEQDTEALLVQHVAPALVDMASFFTPACMETDLSRWEPPTPADQDIISYFGFFAGMPDPLYGIFQYINPLLLSIWMERINASINGKGRNTKAAAQEAWFKILARLLILPEGYLGQSSQAAAPVVSVTPSPTGSGNRRLH